jgi:hypothetical protein
VDWNALSDDDWCKSVKQDFGLDTK